jgi:hypothetical protein
VARQLGGAWRELTRIRTEVTEEVRSAFPIDDLPHIPHIPNASAAVSSFVSGFTDPIRSTLGGALSATNGVSTAGSEQVVSHVEGETETWASVADGAGAPTADLDEGTEWADHRRTNSESVAFPPPEDWSLFADDPSMN